jgi:hypothetical protein
MIRTLLAFAITLLLSLSPRPALAQDGESGEPSASQVALARRLFADGVRAAEEHRLDDARAAFERSYALSAREVTLLNLAVVLAESGKLVAAVDAYRRFLARADGAIEARHGQNARTALAELEGRLASVTITARNLRDRDEVRIDDTVIAREGLGLAVPIDPGTHIVEVRRGRRSCARHAIRVAERASSDVELVANCPPSAEETAAAAAAAAEAAEAEAERNGTAPMSPWVWVGVGGGALVVAAAVVVTVLLLQPEPLDPFVGNLGPGTIALP